MGILQISGVMESRKSLAFSAASLMELLRYRISSDSFHKKGGLVSPEKFPCLGDDFESFHENPLNAWRREHRA